MAEKATKPKKILSRVYLPEALKSALATEARELGRLYSAHVEQKLADHTPGYKAAKGVGK